MNPWAMVGLVLWRGGTLFLLGFVAFETVRYVLRFVDVPPLVGTALALAGAGFLLVMVSLIWERLAEVRREKGAMS